MKRQRTKYLHKQFEAPSKRISGRRTVKWYRIIYTDTTQNIYNKEQSIYRKAIRGTIKRTSGRITVIWYIIIYRNTWNRVEHDWYKPRNQNLRMRDNMLPSPFPWLQPTTRI